MTMTMMMTTNDDDDECEAMGLQDFTPASHGGSCVRRFRPRGALGVALLHRVAVALEAVRPAGPAAHRARAGHADQAELTEQGHEVQHGEDAEADEELERRRALLKRAARDDFLVVEDDYEFEMSFMTPPSPALKS